MSDDRLGIGRLGTADQGVCANCGGAVEVKRVIDWLNKESYFGWRKSIAISGKCLKCGAQYNKQNVRDLNPNRGSPEVRKLKLCNMADSMPGPVSEALRLYLNQTSRRSLRQLAEECTLNGIKTSLPTLKRWSVRYGWQQQVAEHDHAVAEQSMAANVDYRLRAMQAQVELIDSAKQRYHWLLDPNNPNLTPAQRRRATRITVSDYVKILKMEDALYKRLERFEAMKAAAPETPTRPYTPQELDAMTRALAEVRYGLPPRRRDRRSQARPDGMAN